jgi:hypothetical protein
MNFNIQPPSTFEPLVYQKTIFLKAVYPLKVYQHTKFKGPTFAGTEFLIDFKSTDVRYFRMLEATGLISMESRSPSITLHQNSVLLKSTYCFKFIRGETQTDRQTDRMLM